MDLSDCVFGELPCSHQKRLLHCFVAQMDPAFPSEVLESRKGLGVINESSVSWRTGSLRIASFPAASWCVTAHHVRVLTTLDP